MINTHATTQQSTSSTDELLPEELAMLLEDEDLTALAAGYSDILFKGVILRVLDRLSEQEKEDLTEVLSRSQDKEESADDVFTFLKAHIPDLDALVDAEAKEIASDSAYLASV